MSDSVTPPARTRARLRVAVGSALGLPAAALLVLVGVGQAGVGPADLGRAGASAVAGPRTSTTTTLVATPVAATTHPTLKRGSHGAQVTKLQKRLKALHYDVGAVNGTFGYDTQHAVYAFQKVQRLTVDGIVGTSTWKKLADPRVLTPRHKLAKAAVEVNLKLRVLFLTKNGKVTRIVDASPGKKSTPTVTGSFTITRRINGWRKSKLGLLWRPNYFHGGYAIHGEGSVPTYAASHGCVRVTVPAMNRLWKKLKVGERVYVYKG